MAEHSKLDLGIPRLCNLVQVSKSSYYHWSKGLEDRELNLQAEKELYFKIKRIFIESLKSYGVPRIHTALIRAGIACSRRQIGRIMRKNKLISVHCKRSFITTTDSSKTKAPADNLLDRNFKAKFPNEKWVGDVTYIRTGEGWV